MAHLYFQEHFTLLNQLVGSILRTDKSLMSKQGEDILASRNKTNEITKYLLNKEADLNTLKADQ